MRNISKSDYANKRAGNTRDFLLSFFDKDSGYHEKLVNGFYLIKQFQRQLDMWVVAIYTQEAYRKKKEYKRKQKK